MTEVHHSYWSNCPSLILSNTLAPVQPLHIWQQGNSTLVTGRTKEITQSGWKSSCFRSLMRITMESSLIIGNNLTMDTCLHLCSSTGRCILTKTCTHMLIPNVCSFRRIRESTQNEKKREVYHSVGKSGIWFLCTLVYHVLLRWTRQNDLSWKHYRCENVDAKDGEAKTYYKYSPPPAISEQKFSLYAITQLSITYK